MRKKPQRAKLFWNGRSQAVRLPKEFRFAGSSVLIRREGHRIILEADNGWPEGWFESFGTLSPDFKRWPQGKAQKRPKMFP